MPEYPEYYYLDLEEMHEYIKKLSRACTEASADGDVLCEEVLHKAIDALLKTKGLVFGDYTE